VEHTDGGRDLVDVLAARAASADKGLDLQVLVGDVDLGLFKLGGDFDDREGGLALSLGVERADACEAVRAAFALEIAEGVRTLDVERDRIDANLGAEALSTSSSCQPIFSQ
jgi:hypothetical protein